MTRYFLSLAFTSCIVVTGLAQNGLIAGPMPGNIDLREAAVWFQFSDAQVRQIRYWPQPNLDNTIRSTAAIPDPEYGFTAIVRFTGLEPGTTYNYQFEAAGKVWSFKTQPLWAHRTDPPEFRLALGSCTYINEEKYDRPGTPYGGDYGIFESIHSASPDVMLWLGDNVYFREPDWNSKSGMIYRYSHTRKTPEMQALLSSCANYAIWDDHDFGPNDANGSFVHKDWSLDVFRHFWANPSYGLEGPGGEGITTQFNWGDIDFFLLDNRFHRVAPGIKGLEPTILGEAQIEWLIQALKYSNAPFKIVAMGGQFLNAASVYENYSTVEAERKHLIELIHENGIKGVIFLSGDRHNTELDRFDFPDGTSIYDLTCSPLTSTAYNNAKETNDTRIDGTYVAQRNFATIDFVGPRKARVARIAVWDVEGNKLWEQNVQAPTK